MTASTSREEARALAGNLATMWIGGRDVLDRIPAAAGDPSLSPWAALQTLDDEEFEHFLSKDKNKETLHKVFGELTRYLASETWFDRALKRDKQLAELQREPVAYFCMEFGLASWLPIYSGGLGILAGDVLKEASDMGLPIVAVGLLYRHGYFTQQLDNSEYQQESYPQVDPATLPLEEAADSSGRALRVAVPIGDHTVYARVWKLRVGRVPLLLLDTDVPENEQLEDRDLIRNLYGGNEDTRVRQELVLGIGGKRALQSLGIQPSVYSMNEGHAAFLGLEVLADNLQDADFAAALSRTRSRIVYTNHTVVPAGNDVFACDLIRRYLTSYAEARGIGIDRLLGLAETATHDSFSMPLLAFGLSGKANAVSQLHAEVIPREWPGYPVEAVTNGVHVPTWIGSDIRALLDEFVPDWHEDEPAWEKIRNIPDERLFAAHERERHAMIEAVNATRSEGKLDPSALTIVWARRFAEYKRAWLVGADLSRLARLMADPNRPVQLVLAGKSHPRDTGGKHMMQSLLQHLQKDDSVASRTAFVENYTECVARWLVAGADVWLNTPRKPLEASGTSGMKSSDNGGIQLTVTDGWAAEVDWWGTGWGLEGRDDQFDAEQLYGFLEDGVVPAFYTRDAAGVPRQWVSMMKNTMILTLSRYSTRRMMLEYVNKLYLPLLQEQSELTLA